MVGRFLNSVAYNVLCHAESRSMRGASAMHVGTFPSNYLSKKGPFMHV